MPQDVPSLLLDDGKSLSSLLDLLMPDSQEEKCHLIIASLGWKSELAMWSPLIPLKEDLHTTQLG